MLASALRMTVKIVVNLACTVGEKPVERFPRYVRQFV